jgi:uncharacterized membrane protein
MLRMKMVFWLFGAVALFSLFAFVFGYFDSDLTDVRRWIGCGLIVAGMVTAFPAVVRLVDDWPRLKPQHNVDVAFLQIGVAVVVLTIACMLGGRFGAFVAPFAEPLPKLAGVGVSP